MRNGTRQLWVRALDSPEATPLAGTEGAYCTPTFSPDGQWVAFWDDGSRELRKMAVHGGPPQTLTRASGILGATWAGDDAIIYSDVDLPGLRKVSSAGGTPAAITQLDTGKGESGHRWPAFLPGHKAFLFVIHHGDNPDHAEVVAQRLDNGQRQVLVRGGTFPQYVPAGYLAFVRGGKLMAVAFDARRLEAAEQTVSVSEDVQESGFGAAQFGLSSEGSLVYVPPSGAQRRLMWVGRDGSEQVLGARPQNYASFRLSPDGRRLAVVVDNQIWLYDLGRNAWTRFTFEGDINGTPVWSPDGKHVAFLSSKEGPRNIFWQRADGSGGSERLTTGEYEHAPSSWSPDGQFLAYVEGHPVTHDDIWILRMSDRKQTPFLRTPFNETAPAFSPDGHWLAYASDESGRYEVYVQPYPGPGAKYQISSEGGAEPAWNPNGKELLYRSGNRMMSVEVALRHTFSAGRARMLFEGQYVTLEAPQTQSAAFCISPDGQRFLMNKQSGVATQINVVLNWFEELKRRTPSGA